MAIYISNCKKYRKKRGSKWTKGQIPNRIYIDQRPEIVDKKERIGDWETDTILGKQGGCVILTLTERKTKFVIIRKLKSKNAKELAQKVIAVLKPYRDKVKTITMDNGFEFYEHSAFAKALAIETYFAFPYHSWERGLNENTNGLILQYFPKGTDFNRISHQQIAKVQHELNNRPRKTLAWATPNFEFLGQFVPLI